MGTIVFDGITLNPNLTWQERQTSDQLAQNVKFTLGGRPVIQQALLLAGQPITLEATQEQGWLTKEVLDELLDRAAAPLNTYILVFDGESIPVIFRHQDPPAVDFKPHVARVTHEATDYFYGLLKLMRI